MRPQVDEAVHGVGAGEGEGALGAPSVRGHRQNSCFLSLWEGLKAGAARPFAGTRLRAVPRRRQPLHLEQPADRAQGSHSPHNEIKTFRRVPFAATCPCRYRRVGNLPTTSPAIRLSPSRPVFPLSGDPWSVVRAAGKRMGCSPHLFLRLERVQWEQLMSAQIETQSVLQNL